MANCILHDMFQKILNCIAVCMAVSSGTACSARTASAPVGSNLKDTALAEFLGLGGGPADAQGPVGALLGGELTSLQIGGRSYCIRRVERNSETGAGSWFAISDGTLAGTARPWTVALLAAANDQKTPTVLLNPSWATSSMNKWWLARRAYHRPLAVYELLTSGAIQRGMTLQTVYESLAPDILFSEEPAEDAYIGQIMVGVNKYGMTWLYLVFPKSSAEFRDCKLSSVRLCTRRR